MRKLSAIVITGAMLLMAWTGLCCAGETFTVRVSATIPAIPGVNAPLLEHESNRPAGPQQVFEPIAEPQTQPVVAQETQERKEQNLQRTEERPTMIVKTFYSK